MNLETKELNINVAGKEGLTRAYKIQRHTPSSPMCFIRTVTGHMLFCQEDHPVWIQSLDGKPTVVEAKDVVMFHDRIWVDNKTNRLEFSYGVEPPDVDVLFDIISNILEDPSSHVISNHPEYFTGDSIYNFCINIDYLSKISNSNLTYLLYHLLFEDIKSNDSQTPSKKIFSFNLVSQLKMVADHLSHSCSFDINTEDGLVYWTLRNAVESDNLIQDINTYVDIEQVLPGIEDYQGYVYDLKTDSEEFLNNNVQTHNSFHCIKKEQLVYVKYNDKMLCISFEKLWNLIQTDVTFTLNDLGLDQFEKRVDNLFVLDKDNKMTKVNKLISHKKQEDTKMVMVRNNNSDFIISQDNHPNMFALNYGGMCHKCIVPFIKTKKLGYWECPDCRQHPHSVQHASDNDFNMVEPKQFKKSKYFSYNNFSIWNNDDAECIPPIDPYLFGMFLAEGSYLYYYKGTHLAGFIITQNSGEIQDNIIKILTEHHDPIVNGRKAIIVYNAELAETMLSVTSRYSWQKSMGSNFIHYSNETLSKILCGFIDGDGSFIQAKSKERCYISLESTSLELIQQLHLILNKFNVNHKITVCTVKKLTKHQSYNIKIFPYDIHSDIFKYSLKVNYNDLPSVSTKETYPTLVSYCKEILFDADEYVYDFTTESGTLMSNGMLTHNTGGAVVFKKVDILKELSDSITDDEEKYLAGMIYQKDNDLYSNTEVTTIKINKSIFKDEYAIEKVGNTYKLPLGYFRMYIGNIEVNATIEMPVEINIHDDYNETADSITLMYGKDVKLFTIKFFKIAPEKIAQSLDALVAGKGPWETPENLYKKFYEALSTFGPWDSCHLEVILATILRNKKDPMIAARLKEPYDPELHSIKSLPSIISWSLGVAYENLGKSLTFGLISKDSKKYSQIEKVLFGEPLSELSIEKLKEKKK